MAFSQADLAAVETALARGERVVQYQDRRVEYRSVDELMRVRNQIQHELTRRAGGGYVRFYHAGKGF
ncbi:phage head-tail joining protein [Chromobacterium vaccinii]|uniref:phage head-tail joining protein n=1 Tax=Chromobacterium vaccinii TaxID=1108595 RepID=UPI0032612B24|nr:Uncharacterized protein ChrSW_1537 [Chromobacterium vaccinii]QND88995.1 Uncharacterized protein ChrSV_1537 [Chromobacterium vaccinii]